MSFNQLKVEDIKKIYTKIYENACELIDEAELLLEHQKYARAYLCAHISVEEFGKLPMLYTVAINVHNGDKVDWKALSKDTRKFLKRPSFRYFLHIILEVLRRSYSNHITYMGVRIDGNFHSLIS